MSSDKWFGELAQTLQCDSVWTPSIVLPIVLIPIKESVKDLSLLVHSLLAVSQTRSCLPLFKTPLLLRQPGVEVDGTQQLCGSGVKCRVQLFPRR